jgi:hypothetical protein
MLVVLMIFCAVGAIFLIGLGAYAEFQELWAHSDHRVAAGSSHPVQPPRSGSHRL